MVSHVLQGWAHEKNFYHNELTLLPAFTPEMLSIDTSKTGFKKKCMITDATALYNIHGGASCCQCKGDCAASNRCSCRKLGCHMQQLAS